MGVETKEIPFYDDTLLGVKDEDGKVWLAVRKACLDIGLSNEQAKRQIRNIRNSELFKSKWGKFAPVQNEGGRQVTREVICIQEKFVPMWLAQITLTPKMKKENPEAVSKLLRYQLEAADVLHTAFYKTDRQKELLHESLGLEGKILKMEEQIVAFTETIKEQAERLDKVMDNMTIDTKKQSRIQKAAKERVSELLGGAHSGLYKAKGALYFANLWHQFREQFECGTYKDLSPNDFEDAIDFIESWTYVER
jgi:hypothetical protein